MLGLVTPFSLFAQKQAGTAKQEQSANNPPKKETKTELNTTGQSSAKPASSVKNGKPEQTSQKPAQNNTKPASSGKNNKEIHSSEQNPDKLRKDGKPDKRYKENKKLKKDGTPDKRFKENKVKSK